MREFFKGGRRKAGCVALVMALAVFGVWMRGYGVSDAFSFGVDEAGNNHWLNSSRDGIRWERYSGAGGVIGWKQFPVPQSGTVFPVDDPEWLSICAVDWRVRSCGFDFGEWRSKQKDAFRCDYWLIPYWSLVLPLTLLSAYLILWKPRKTPAKPVVEDDG